MADQNFASNVATLFGGTANRFLVAAGASSVVSQQDASTARTTLGLGTLATQSPTGTPDGTKFLRDDLSWQTVTGGSTFLNVQPSIGGTNGTAVVADSASDTLTLDTGYGATIAGNASTDTITINAFGVLQPPYCSFQSASNYYHWGVASSGMANISANVLNKRPILIPKRATITAVTIPVQSATAGAAARLGLRNMNQDTGEPTTLVSEFGVIDCSTNGAKTISSLSVTVDPGWYYLEFICNSGTPTFAVASVANSPKIGSTNSGGGFTQNNGLTRSLTYGALPVDETGVAQTMFAGNLFSFGLRF